MYPTGEGSKAQEPRFRWVGVFGCATVADASPGNEGVGFSNAELG